MRGDFVFGKFSQKNTATLVRLAGWNKPVIARISRIALKLDALARVHSQPQCDEDERNNAIDELNGLVWVKNADDGA